MFRVIRPSGKFGSLYPSAKCEKVPLGKGDTDFSVLKMEEWIRKHQSQTVDVAKQLKKSSLEQTCVSIHDHLYWNFQYKADLDDQLLRSPACAWQQRNDGIDCKSYSILASSILLNLGINHYIKKVGYTTPGEFTHVYVVVPVDQQTNDLENGYYMIDGTINTLEEPFFLDHKETLMLSHYGLNAPHSRLNGSVDWSKLLGLKSNDLQGLISGLRCLGGSAYTGDLFNANIQKLKDFCNETVLQFNQNAAAGNYAAAAENWANLNFISVFVYAHHEKKYSNNWNSCSWSNFDAFLIIGQRFDHAILPTFAAYIDKYFNKTFDKKVTLTNVGLEAQGWTFMEGNFQVNHVIDQYTITPKTSQIPAFEFTAPLVAGIENDAAPNITTYLSTLQNVLSAFNTNPGSTSGGTYTQEPEPNPTSPDKKDGYSTTTILAGIAGMSFLAYKIFR